MTARNSLLITTNHPKQKTHTNKLNCLKKNYDEL